MGRTPRPTIHDVARVAGISATTVSHVLNQTRFVADETRSRVLAAVDSLGYDPNAAARSLRSRRRYIIGLVITNPHNRGFASFVDGIDEVLIPAGFSTILSATRGESDRELACLRLLEEQRVDGLILAGTASARTDYVRRLHESGLPMVQLNRVWTTLPIDSVELDYGIAGRLLAIHLLSLGHRRFALIGGIGGVSWQPHPHPFRVGWDAALLAADLGPEATWSGAGPSREEVGYRLARAALTEGERPTAVVAGNAPLALGALLACSDLGIVIPRDLSLATMGDAGWNRLTSPPITTIPDALPEWGGLAARFLLDRILGRYDGPPRQEIFPAELIVRGSTGIAPASRLVTIKEA